MHPSDSPAPKPPSGSNANEAPAPLAASWVPADLADVASALAYALRCDERGRPRRDSGAMWEMAAAPPAGQLTAQLEQASFVVMRKAPQPPRWAE